VQMEDHRPTFRYKTRKSPLTQFRDSVASSLGGHSPQSLHWLQWEEADILKLTAHMLETDTVAALKICMLLDLEQIFQTEIPVLHSAIHQQTE